MEPTTLIVSALAAGAAAALKETASQAVKKVRNVLRFPSSYECPIGMY